MDKARAAIPPPPETPTTLNAPKATKQESSDNLKSFKVSLEDPTWKVLPAALKKYRINNDNWQSYAMFICYGPSGKVFAGNAERRLLNTLYSNRKPNRKMLELRRKTAASLPETEGCQEEPRIHAQAHERYSLAYCGGTAETRSSESVIHHIPRIYIYYGNARPPTSSINCA